MPTPIEVLSGAMRDLNRRVTELEEDNAKLVASNNGLVQHVNQLIEDMNQVKDVIWPQSHIMKPQDLEASITAMSKDDPVETFARGTKDNDALSSYFNRGDEYD